jgi:hypothetical protein
MFESAGGIDAGGVSWFREFVLWWFEGRWLVERARDGGAGDVVAYEDGGFREDE